MVQPGGTSTPAPVPHLFWIFCQSGLSAAALVEHTGRRRGCAVPAGDEVSREGSRRLLWHQASLCRGEQEFFACAAAGGVRVPDGVRVGF
jgi:hypothetical protein